MKLQLDQIEKYGGYATKGIAMKPQPQKKQMAKVVRIVQTRKC